MKTQIQHKVGLCAKCATAQDSRLKGGDQFQDGLMQKLYKNPTNWWGRQNNTASLKFDPKPLEAAFSAVFFSIFDLCRSEVADHVISGVDDRVKLVILW